VTAGLDGDRGPVGEVMGDSGAQLVEEVDDEVPGLVVNGGREDQPDIRAVI
jgi:hypothetical protein